MSTFFEKIQSEQNVLSYGRKTNRHIGCIWGCNMHR